MVHSRLAAYDRSTISVEFSQNGIKKECSGKSAYAADPVHGGLLIITICEPWGEFDVVLHENEWDGEIELGGATGCDFKLSLCSAVFCTA